jgi:hypothetical protein
MADPIVAEAIPDSALLYRRIHRHFFDSTSGRISSAAFDGMEMSVNWERYATPAETAAQDLTGNTVVVASLTAQSCRHLEQIVRHDPVAATDTQLANPAHSLVCGKKSKPIKQKLRDAAIPVWLQPPV